MQVSTQLLPVFTLDFFWKEGERKGGCVYGIYVNLSVSSVINYDVRVYSYMKCVRRKKGIYMYQRGNQKP